MAYQLYSKNICGKNAHGKDVYGNNVCDENTGHSILKNLGIH